MYEYLLSCIVFHEKEYKDKLCCAASYIEIYMIYMCICVFFLSEVAIISKLYFNLLDRSFVLITIQFDIINFFLIYSNTILKNSIHIALTKSIFFFGQILWCYTICIYTYCGSLLKLKNGQIIDKWKMENNRNIILMITHIKLIHICEIQNR